MNLWPLTRKRRATEISKKKTFLKAALLLYSHGPLPFAVIRQTGSGRSFMQRKMLWRANVSVVALMRSNAQMLFSAPCALPRPGGPLHPGASCRLHSHPASAQSAANAKSKRAGKESLSSETDV